MEQMTIEDFIKRLCNSIETLKQEHSYFAFVLIAIGIEFLGACMDTRSWTDSRLSKKRFNHAIQKFPTLKQYKSTKLYKYLRCGMCHVATPTCPLRLSNGSGVYNPKDNILYIEDFYNDFRAACEHLISDTKLWGKGKMPSDIWWQVYTSSDRGITGTTIHDTTQYKKSHKQNYKQNKKS